MDVQLCLKVNKGLRKCHINCVGRNVWALEKYIMTDVFDTSSQSAVDRESSQSAVLGASQRQAAAPDWRTSFVSDSYEGNTKKAKF